MQVLQLFVFYFFLILFNDCSSVSYAGSLPCGDWDCECAFKRQQGCCCIEQPLFDLEEATFIRMVGLWEGLSHLNTQIEELTGVLHYCHFTFAYCLGKKQYEIFPWTVTLPLLSVPSSSWMQNSFHRFNASNEWMSWAVYQQHVYLVPVCLTQSGQWLQSCTR